jgi:farnesyl-diphosphate farnesyltransferase
LESVNGELEKQVLKGVSRSFYLSLRLLPRPMRGAASLGYLLARTSDTLADSTTTPMEFRVKYLDQFRQAVAARAEAPRWPVSILNAIPDARERHLLECSGEIFAGLGRLPTREADLVREVVEIITSGQLLDLERFASASGAHPVALGDEAALEDYAWRVAGCVGAFWTRLGFLTLGDSFSRSSEPALLQQGIVYGKGLQLVNILRDVAADLAVGRCYLPVTDPQDSAALLDCHAFWLARADEWLAEGRNYGAQLGQRRLRAASVLPAMIGQATLEKLRGASWETLQTRIKVPRTVIYKSLVRAFFIVPGMLD